MEYNNLELYHYGVKGMKWGVRRKSASTSTSGGGGKKSSVGQKVGKVVSKRIEKVRAKNEKRKKSYQTTTDWFGVGGAALRSHFEYQNKKAAKGITAHVLNSVANDYISSGKGNHYTRVGVDYARRAAVRGLSLSTQMDKIQAYANVAQAAMYQAGKRNN